MFRDSLTDQPDAGLILDETARAMAMMFVSGVCAGVSALLVVLWFGIPAKSELLAAGLCLAGAAMFWKLSMMVLPDAQTVAVRVEESRKL